MKPGVGRSVLAVLVVALGLGGLSSVHAASIQGPRRSALQKLEEGDAIRNRLLLRGGRFEVAPVLGFTLNDAFQRNVLFGAQIAYHLNDDWGIGATGLLGVALDSDLTDRIRSERPKKVKADSFSSVGVLGTVEVLYTPLIGKLALFGRHVFNYDIHTLVGLGATLVKGDTKVEGATPTAVVGLGVRTFIRNGMAVNFQVRDYIYSSALNAVSSSDGGKTKASESFSNNFATTIGVAFFFPQDPKISD